MPDLLVAASVEVEHAGDGLVEQVEVVADHEQRAAVVPQEAEQPLLGVGVEVVGGLVEQEQVGAGEEDADELDPPALAARQHAEREVEAVVGEAEAGGQAADVGVGPVAAVDARTAPRPARSG